MKSVGGFFKNLIVMQLLFALATPVAQVYAFGNPIKSDGDDRDKRAAQACALYGDPKAAADPCNEAELKDYAGDAQTVSAGVYAAATVTCLVECVAFTSMGSVCTLA